MKSTLLLTLLFISSFVLAQTKKEKQVQTTTIPPIEVNIDMPETLNVQDITPKNNTPWFERNLAWIVALIIGFLSAGVNLWIAKRQRDYSEASLKRQIDSAKETTMMQFKATMGTKNRQEWINELRQTLAELITTCGIIGMEREGDYNDGNLKHLVEKALLADTKLRVLINVNKKEQKDLQICANEMLRIASDSEEYSRDALQRTMLKSIEAGRVVFDKHWEKIKKLE